MQHGSHEGSLAGAQVAGEVELKPGDANLIEVLPHCVGQRTP